MWKYGWLALYDCWMNRVKLGTKHPYWTVDLHFSKPLFSLDPDNLQLHCFFLGLGTLFCCSFFCPFHQPCKTLQTVQVAPYCSACLFGPVIWMLKAFFILCWQLSTLLSTFEVTFNSEKLEDLVKKTNAIAAESKLSQPVAWSSNLFGEADIVKQWYSVLTYLYRTLICKENRQTKTRTVWLEACNDIGLSNV